MNKSYNPIVFDKNVNFGPLFNESAKKLINYLEKILGRDLSNIPIIILIANTSPKKNEDSICITKDDNGKEVIVLVLTPADKVNISKAIQIGSYTIGDIVITVYKTEDNEGNEQVIFSSSANPVGSPTIKIGYLKLLLVSITKSINQLGKTMSEAVEGDWGIKDNEVNNIDYVCGVNNCVLSSVYKPEEWYKVSYPNKKGYRWCFEGPEVLNFPIINKNLGRIFYGSSFVYWKLLYY